MEIRQMTRSTTVSRKSGRLPVQGSEQLNQRIREKAFELYQSRGGAHGDDQADWYEAERIVLQKQGQVTSGVGRSAASRGNNGRGRTMTGRRKLGRTARA
jgi:hypothetical protein